MVSGVQRILLWFLSTVSVVVLLFGYHTSTSGPAATATPPALITGSTASGGSGGTSGSSGSGGTSGGSGSGGSTEPIQPAEPTQPAESTTVTGGVAQTEWGPVQVQVTLSGRTITDVAVLQYPNSNGKDVEINSYALPILIQQTLDAQSAQIDMVSGATVTSTGYVQSLQSALDQAGL